MRMIKKIILLILMNIFLSQVFGYTIDLYTFFEAKKNQIVTEPGMMWGLGVDAEWNGFTFNAEMLETNYQIGDIKLLWPQKVKLFEDTYYPFGQSVLTYSIPEFEISVGLQDLNEGLGSEYPLFISSNNSPYPSLKTVFRPFEWVTFQQDLLFLRTAIVNPLNSENVQTAKSVYYRKTTFSPFDFLSIGFEESVLFMGRDYDLYYLFSPLNYITSQDIRSTKNAPWNSPENDNCMLGGFIELKYPLFRIFSEVLVDDWSWSQESAGVRKVAWDTGADVYLEDGLFQVEFAGASRYTFHKTGQYPYQYVRYEEYSELPMEYNLIGYKYGENNAAVNVKYTHYFENVEVCLNGEYLVFGHRDPFSPLPPDWQQQDQFRWLDDEVLQKETTIGISGAWNISPKITVKGGIGTTFIENEGLVSGKNGTSPYFDFSVEYKFSVNDEVIEKLKEGRIFDIDFF